MLTGIIATISPPQVVPAGEYKITVFIDIIVNFSNRVFGNPQFGNLTAHPGVGDNKPLVYLYGCFF